MGLAVSSLHPILFDKVVYLVVAVSVELRYRDRPVSQEGLAFLY